MSPKSKWRFTETGEDWFCFAGQWRPAVDDMPASFTMSTNDPGPDVTPVHNRQVVMLEYGDWRSWLDFAWPESERLQPLPTGGLQVEQVR